MVQVLFHRMKNYALFLYIWDICKIFKDIFIDLQKYLINQMIVYIL